MFRVRRVQLAFMERRTSGMHIYIYIYIKKSTVRLTGVGLAQARPNNMHVLCLSRLCLANEGIRVCASVPRWKHGLLEDAVYDQMWKQSFCLKSVQLPGTSMHIWLS